jgi:mannobiose 2-epimerase
MEINNQLDQYRSELEQELENILAYWGTKPVDNENGGFYGRIDLNGSVDPVATKGSVLHARILWTFSAAWLHKKDPQLLFQAHRVYQYILDYFIDQVNGGIYWSITYDGSPADTKKQIYAIAFAIYGLSEYYRCTQNEEVRQLAIQLFTTIEEHAFDPVYGGYIEALTADWKPIDDLRLSDKDANEKKSMNTHLHILEAYTNLYLIWPDEKVKKQLQLLIGYFTGLIFNPATHHLNLFFNEQWERRSDVISYGHDIEACWLLADAVKIAGDEILQQKINAISVSIAVAVKEGLDTDGGLFYEYFPAEKKLIREKHWWPQAEAMVGFFHVWQLTSNEKYLKKSLQSWSFIKTKLLDQTGGEWYWGINANGHVMDKEDKAGFWKCPYHNSRACLEIIKRINTIII